mgnify:CR=1 FL=1
MHQLKINISFIDARAGTFQAFELFGQQLLQVRKLFILFTSKIFKCSFLETCQAKDQFHLDHIFS